MANYKRPSARSAAAPQTTREPVLDDAMKIERVADGERDLVFGRQTFIWIGIGIALMVVSMLLMAGGAMPNPDVWDDSLIYSFRRITLAPMVLLAGLGVITYAILKK